MPVLSSSQTLRAMWKWVKRSQNLQCSNPQKDRTPCFRNDLFGRLATRPCRTSWRKFLGPVICFADGTHHSDPFRYSEGIWERKIDHDFTSRRHWNDDGLNWIGVNTFFLAGLSRLVCYCVHPGDGGKARMFCEFSAHGEVYTYSRHKRFGLINVEKLMINHPPVHPLYGWYKPSPNRAEW